MCLLLHTNDGTCVRTHVCVYVRVYVCVCAYVCLLMSPQLHAHMCMMNEMEQKFSAASEVKTSVSSFRDKRIKTARYFTSIDYNR